MALQDIGVLGNKARVNPAFSSVGHAVFGARMTFNQVTPIKNEYPEKKMTFCSRRQTLVCFSHLCSVGGGSLSR